MNIKEFENFRNYELTSLVVPQNTKIIGDCAFGDCINLKNVSFPDGLTNIGKSAFSYCERLESIEFSPLSKLKKIDEFAFSKCFSLKTAILPYSVERIEKQAFGQCFELEKLIMPEKIDFIEKDAFLGCNPKQILYKNKEFSNINKFLEYFEEEKKEKLEDAKSFER